VPFSFRDSAQLIALEAIVGVAIGAILGLLLRLSTRREFGGAWVDAILGAIGYAGGAIVTTVSPWRLNTVTERVGDTIVSTTTKRYPHPYQIAFVLAVFLPLVWEAFCMKRNRRKAK
jgi:hypothetical protein